MRYKILLISALIVSVTSCKKYLDVTPDDVATLNSSFANANETQSYLVGNCYSILQRLADVARNPGFTASGEVIIPTDLPSNQSLPGSGQDAGFNLMRGFQNAQNPLINYWDAYNQGLNMWQAIRFCNTFLDNVNTAPDLTPDLKIRWIAEAKFLKAYYHYWLIRMYGAIPIADAALPVNASSDQVRQKQQPVDSCFNYVVRLLDEAIPDLPPTIMNTITEDGRVTQVVALAVKAEVLATQASPLFNGNPDYAGFKDVDGKPLYPASADASKWQKAADACKAAIDAAQASGAGLYQFVPQSGITHMSDSTKKLMNIQGAITDSWNIEQIWTLNPGFGYQIQASPRVTADATTVYDFFSNFSVPMGETELFYTNHGVPISEDITWDYPNRYKVVQGDDANSYYVKKGYSTNKGNLNREERYYADIAFDGGIWFGFGNTDDNNPNYVNAVNGPASPSDPISYNSTGYWPKKLVPYQTASSNSNFVQKGYSWPFMRLTALWLLYAECLNEAAGPGAQTYKWIDMVRARADLPGVLQAWAAYSRNPSKPTTKDGLRDIIHQERRIELAFEGQAGWDLRRWKELQNLFATPFVGWSVQTLAKTTSAYYNLHTVYQPQFGLKDYLFPIQKYDLLVNSNLVQTPYW
ncbi:MAG: RagB/SusD family nutrient uptake outer membrane protein [Bacteroidetes bacterium]|nr:RagB/SusD family nutrient uptake outer membrane protein [Bacteroidota bacterium]